MIEVMGIISETLRTCSISIIRDVTWRDVAFCLIKEFQFQWGPGEVAILMELWLLDKAEDQQHSEEIFHSCTKNEEKVFGPALSRTRSIRGSEAM